MYNNNDSTHLFNACEEHTIEEDEEDDVFDYAIYNTIPEE